MSAATPPTLLAAAPAAQLTPTPGWQETTSPRVSRVRNSLRLLYTLIDGGLIEESVFIANSDFPRLISLPTHVPWPDGTVDTIASWEEDIDPSQGCLSNGCSLVDTFCEGSGDPGEQFWLQCTPDGSQ